MLYLDGIEFKGQLSSRRWLSRDEDGSGRQDERERAVVGELLDDLVARGVDFSVPMLYVLDGAKALTKALHKHAGNQALVQRCQLHKRRNVTATCRKHTATRWNAR